MIISHKYKFIFIKTRKTAGTSIEIYLSKYCGDDDILTHIAPYETEIYEKGYYHKEQNSTGLFNPLIDLLYGDDVKKKDIIGRFKRRIKFYQHMPGSVIRRRIPGNIWDSYYKFCVERNPWDKAVSHYYFYSRLKKFDLSFVDYIKNYIFPVDHNKYMEGSKVIVDRILKYEKLDEELGSVFNMLGIPYEGKLNISAKGSIRKNNINYREMYSNDQKDIIGKAFKNEIRIMGYRF